MRIAIATEDSSTVAAHTGRCAAFAIFDIADGKAMRLEDRPNTFTGHARGECHHTGEGAATHSHQGPEHKHHSHHSLLDALADCKALVTRGLGPRLVADLRSRGIDVHVCSVKSVEQAAEYFARGHLPRLTDGGCCPKY